MPLALVAGAGRGRRALRRLAGARELRASPQALVVAADAVSLDGVPLGRPVLQWRGPLAWLRYRDAAGRLRHRFWWPDTLDAAGRRELRLAWPVQAPTPDSLSMAP